MYKESPKDDCNDQSSSGSSSIRDQSSGESHEVDIAEGKEEVKRSSLLSSFDESIRHAGNCCENKALLAKTILSGQVLSLMLSATGTAATAQTTQYGISTPCFNAFLMYVLLASTFGVHIMTRKEFKPIIKRHWWKYGLVALLDVEANYLLTKAYSYTTLTSVQLCDSFTIPTTMIISFIFLRIRYKALHYIGVVLCIGGAICLVFTDGYDKKANGSNEVLGDVIALIAAALYGTSNVGQEYLVKKYSAHYYLGMVGLVGVFVTAIQTAALEHNQISSIHWDWKIALIFAAFAVCQYFYYAVMPIVMKLSSATVVNLSLLTSDLYTLLIGLFLFGYKFSYLYFIAFAGILLGLIVYNIRPPPTAPPKVKEKRRKKITNNKCTQSSFKLENGHTIYFYKTENGQIYQKMKNVKTPLLETSGNGFVSYTRL